MRDKFLITGPTFAGKTQLYYKLQGGNIGESVSSSDVNETTGSVSIKVPHRLIGNEGSERSEEQSAYARIETKLIDVPGHYNFKKTT